MGHRQRGDKHRYLELFMLYQLIREKYLTMKCYRNFARSVLIWK